MKTTTELIDELNRAERGERMTVRTEAAEYDGEILETHFAAPESREEGIVGVDIRVEGGDHDGARLEVRSTAGSSTQKFSRPVARLPDEDVPEREILDLVSSEE